MYSSYGRRSTFHVVLSEGTQARCISQVSRRVECWRLHKASCLEVVAHRGQPWKAEPSIQNISVALTEQSLQPSLKKQQTLTVVTYGSGKENKGCSPTVIVDLRRCISSAHVCTRVSTASKKIAKASGNCASHHIAYTSSQYCWRSFMKAKRGRLQKKVMNSAHAKRTNGIYLFEAS